MNHQAIFNTHPSVVQIVGDTAYESVDGELVQVALDVDAVAAEEAKLQAEYVATQYQRDREPEYPSLAEFADAYYWSQKGDDTKMTAYVAACDAVKTKYPKPEVE